MNRIPSSNCAFCGAPLIPYGPNVAQWSNVCGECMRNIVPQATSNAYDPSMAWEKGAYAPMKNPDDKATNSFLISETPTEGIVAGIATEEGRQYFLNAEAKFRATEAKMLADIEAKYTRWLSDNAELTPERREWVAKLFTKLKTDGSDRNLGGIQGLYEFPSDDEGQPVFEKHDKLSAESKLDPKTTLEVIQVLWKRSLFALLKVVRYTGEAIVGTILVPPYDMAKAGIRRVQEALRRP
jgi:hypothetical protein